MKYVNLYIVVPVGLAILALVIFLIKRNRKDKSVLNPDAPDAVDETIMDQEREHPKD